MSRFAVSQTYINHLTGEHWTRTLKRRWKTRRGAEAAAQRDYSWATKPDGKTCIDESRAVVVEIGGAA